MTGEPAIISCDLCGKEVQLVDAYEYQGEMSPLTDSDEDGFEKTLEESHLMCKSCSEWFWLDRIDAWHQKKRENDTHTSK